MTCKISECSSHVTGALMETALSSLVQDCFGVMLPQPEALHASSSDVNLRCRAALAIRPRDYSLWNKLGATLANSSSSQEAIAAYQKALDLKPNYMRAWTNMGIAQVQLSAGACTHLRESVC